MVVHEPEVFARDPTPPEPVSPSVWSVIVTTASSVASSADPAIIDQVKAMFAIFFFFFFYMNGNTERAQCALSRVCIP